MWSADEFRRFWGLAQADGLAVFFWLLLTTGMRQGEILGLSWDAIDWDRRWIQIRQTLFWPDGAYTPVLQHSPKTPVGFRTVVVGDYRVALMRRQQQ